MTATFLIWYGTQRFSTDFLRAYDERVAGLTGAQFLCLGLIAAGVVLAIRLRGGKESVVPAVADPA
jgi:prolipoprotein diacylglyceryltransferase